MSTSVPFIFNYQAVEVELQRQCDFFFKQKLGMDVTMSLQFNIPNNLESLIIQNKTLKARAKLSWDSQSKEIIINFPAPYHGVFIIRSDKDSEASKRCWIPLLADKQGDWVFKKYKEKGSELFFRKAFPGGRYLELPIGTGKKLKKGKNVPTVIQVNSDGIRFAFSDEKTEVKRKFQKTTETLEKSELYPIDDQDLQNKRLLTFTNYIVEGFIRQLVNSLRAIFREEKRYRKIIRSEIQTITHKEQEEFWQGLVDREALIGWQLVPVDYLISTGRLELFSPLNNIDAVSQLTSLKRYPFSKNLPAIFHQNHPSFRNIICPIETPESADVGITVHLAKGVETDIWGNFYPGDNSDTYLGYAASLVPFFQHNDAVRVMMGAKNLRQAVPLIGAEAPTILTKHEKTIINNVSPLVESKLVANEFADFKSGRQLLVAYMPWYGYNFEDAIVANSDLVTNGQLNWQFEEQFTKYVLPGYTPDVTKGEMKIGDTICTGDVIAEFSPKTNDDSPLVHQGEQGILIDLKYIDPKSEFIGGILKWTVNCKIPLQVGSKMMARYGNKGVISKFFSPDQMPRLPEDNNLPIELRGRPVDLVLNPHGVISRMNLGQLLETQYTMAASLGFTLPPDIGKAFNKADHSELLKFFESKSPFDKYGRIKLQYEGESLTESAVTVGYQYYSVLRHIPSQKAHVRRGKSQSDRYNVITGQPVAGKANNGGQRIGEMEFWALAAHQANNIINEFLTHRSDATENTIFSQTQTTQAILDHLFCLGFKFDKTGAVTAVTDNDVSCKAKPVKSNKTRIPAVKGVFKCPKCNFELLNGEKIVSTARSQRSTIQVIDVLSVLDHFGYEILKTPDIDFNKPTKEEGPQEKEFEVVTSKGYLKLGFVLKPSGIALRFNIDNIEFIAKSRFDRKYTISTSLSLTIRCPKHTTESLRANNAKRQVKIMPGGLYDENIFGTFETNNPELSWGYLELPYRISHPITEQSINKIPILPVKYRSTNSALFLARWEEHEITESYARIIRLCSLYKKLPDKKEEEKQQKKLKYSVIALYNKIKIRTFGKSGKSKYGLLRRHGLGRRLDYSGRLVIVPDPTLDWDEVSVPVNVLAVLYGKQIAEKLESEDLNNYFAECENIKTPCPDEEAVLVELQNHFKTNRTRVLLNRAPSLHKYNIASFKPIPHFKNEGQVLKLNPIVFKGFGADADGDEMSIHALLDEKSISEAEKLSPVHKQNILSVASGKPVLDFDQDFVLGNYLLNDSEVQKNGLTRFKDIIEIDTDFKQKILAEMRSSFTKVTNAGVSFSYLELLSCILGEKEIDSAFLGIKESVNEVLETLTDAKLKTILENTANPGYYFAAMAISGARGKKQTRQVLGARGILDPGLIGFDPDNQQFQVPESLVNGMNTESSYLSTYNSRSSMIDKNIGTYKAGYFMRKLVLALWPWHIAKRACGSSSQNECKLLSEYKICKGCYGVNVPDMYPAGLIAAQSIGERCTQLTMSSFHSGEKGVSLSDVEKLLADTPDNFNSFFENLHEVSALKNIKEEHFFVLWSAIKASPDSTLNSAIKSGQTNLSAAASIDGLGMILQFIKSSESVSSEHPMDDLIQSSWGWK
jgi:hypothetical protein